ncbi:uncharacterized protein BDW47DRAFT_121424 [Aspergillus candidus]|uniref:Secreted protein n=1 Tax=Aspergillus candidus TaxID=41067 RepID=A0A2I2EXU0_ASPCN|nr:hypothetical protein BDW47DRAFT_121424 [Aspergillus candidus]PLB33192.1 hypothetical protein BDW47DRAFT_121424 [Aspergillus candidus]
MGMMLPLASWSVLALHRTFIGIFARVLVGVSPRGPLQNIPKRFGKTPPNPSRHGGNLASQSSSDLIVLGDDNLFCVGRTRDISSHANGSRMPIPVSQTITYMLHTSRLIDHDRLSRWSFH